MTQNGLIAARVLSERFADAVGTLTAEEFDLPSRCAGWTVKDVVAHTSSNYRSVVEPASAPLADPPLAAEQAAEHMVGERRDWSYQRVLAELHHYRAPWLAALAEVQKEPTASVQTVLNDLGTHPLHILPDVFAFDLACHLYVDLLSPEGPITRDLPGLDAETLSPGIGWMLAGLPQMCPAVNELLVAPIGLRLTGPGGGEWILESGDVFLQIRERLAPDVETTVESSTWDFLLWGTTRTPWRERVVIEGDADYAATVLDRVNII